MNTSITAPPAADPPTDLVTVPPELIHTFLSPRSAAVLRVIDELRCAGVRQVCRLARLSLAVAYNTLAELKGRGLIEAREAGYAVTPAGRVARAVFGGWPTPTAAPG